MPNNIGSNNNGSQYYVSGGVQWNTKPNINRPSSINTPILNVDGLAHTIEWITCADVTIDVPNSTINISTHNKSTYIYTGNITSFPYVNNIMTINTLDDIPSILIFIDQATCDIVNKRIYDFINSGTDSSCGVGIINNLSVDGITSSNAVINWDSVYNAKNYFIKLTTSSVVPSDYTTDVFNNSNSTAISLSSQFTLTTATDYWCWVYVMYNDSSHSNWQEISFTTL